MEGKTGDHVDMSALDSSIDGEEEILFENSGDADENEFDFVVGVLENIVMSPEFLEVQKQFCDEHCQIFDESEENKLIYTDIFRKYTTLIESSLERKLKEEIPGFEMHLFESLLKVRGEEISGEIFDVLLSYTDFNEFKQFFTIKMILELNI